MQTTSDLDMLPNETLYGICEEMDYDQLMNLSSVYYRTFQVCSDLIQKREKQKVTEVLHELIEPPWTTTTWQVSKIIRSINPLTGFAQIRYFSYVTLEYKYDKLLVSQEIGNSWKDLKDQNNFQPVIPNMTNAGIRRHSQLLEKEISLDDPKSLFELHNNLLKNHYEKWWKL